MEKIVKDYYMNSYLAHHGIKGQRWGIRRFQNKDGSLTNAGRMRRQSLVGGQSVPASKITKKEIDSRLKTSKSRDGVYNQYVDSLKNNKEIAAMVNRDFKAEKQDLEDKYTDRLNKELEKIRPGLSNEKKIPPEILKSPKIQKVYDAYARDLHKLVDLEPKRMAKRSWEIAQEEAKKYVDDYNNAFVKDAGFDDVESGKKCLQDNGYKLAESIDLSRKMRNDNKWFRSIGM